MESGSFSAICDLCRRVSRAPWISLAWGEGGLSTRAVHVVPLENKWVKDNGADAARGEKSTDRPLERTSDRGATERELYGGKVGLGGWYLIPYQYYYRAFVTGCHGPL